MTLSHTFTAVLFVCASVGFARLCYLILNAVF